LFSFSLHFLILGLRNPRSGKLHGQKGGEIVRYSFFFKKKAQEEEKREKKPECHTRRRNDQDNHWVSSRMLEQTYLATIKQDVTIDEMCLSRRNGSKKEKMLMETCEEKRSNTI
jgi:hypothetical protein